MMGKHSEKRRKGGTCAGNDRRRKKTRLTGVSGGAGTDGTSEDKESSREKSKDAKENQNVKRMTSVSFKYMEDRPRRTLPKAYMVHVDQGTDEQVWPRVKFPTKDREYLEKTGMVSDVMDALLLGDKGRDGDKDDAEQSEKNLLRKRLKRCKIWDAVVERMRERLFNNAKKAKRNWARATRELLNSRECKWCPYFDSVVFVKHSFDYY